MAAMQPETVHELFRRQAEIHGDAAAIHVLNAPDLSYGGLIGQMDRVAAALAGWGIRRGERVLIRLANGPESFIAWHGAAMAAVAMIVDPQGSATEFEHFLRFVEPKAVIMEHGVENDARALAQKYDVRVIDIIPTPEAGVGSFRFAEPTLPAVPALNGPDDLAYLVPTSGTTALPKLVPKSQRAMLTVLSYPIKTQYRATGETAPLHLITFLPMHILFGMMLAGAAIASGGSIACMPGFDGDALFHWIDVYRPYFIGGPPAVLEQMLALAPRHLDVLARYRPRYVYTGASPLSEAVRVGLHTTFDAPIVQTYGMTEVGNIAQSVLRVGDPAPTAVGPVSDAKNTRVIALDGLVLPAGEEGEIIFRSGHFTGYWNNPEANADAFIDGWFRTGDLGRVDADGMLTLIGRVKEVINSGGAKVSPSEVEGVLRQDPHVKDVAVFGLRHAELGETVAAAVVGAVSERDLRKFAAERLPFYKVPMRIVIVGKIPTAASGKVQRNRLAEQLGLK